MKLFYKLISCILIVSMVTTNCANVFAQNKMLETPKVITETKPTEKQLEQTVKKDPQILYELLQKREKKTKYFFMDDESITAAIYPEAVHYRKDGKWEDIDNSLEEIKNIDGETVLSNKSNSFNVKFAKNSSNKNLVKFEKSDYSISWSLDNSNQVEATQELPADTSSNLSTNDKAKVLKNRNSSAKYKEIVPNVDLEYVLTAQSVKENIILNSLSAQNTFTFKYDFGELQPKLNDDKTISVFYPDMLDKPVFTFNAPYMYDSEGEYSSDVSISLDKEEEIYKLTLTANKEWLESQTRSFPVTIDPTIRTDQDKSSISDAFIFNTQKDFERGDAQILRVGKSSGSKTKGNIFRSYVKVDIPPEIGSADRIIDAKLYLIHDRDISKYNPTNNNMRINAHEVTQIWDEKITWSDNISYNQNIIEDYSISNFSNENTSYDSFNITKLAQKWHIYGNNNGVLLKSNNENEFKEVQYYSKDTSTGYYEARPMVDINYRNFVGIENYWTYHSQDAGRAGTGYVNDYTGNLVWVHNDVNMTGTRMPASVSHIYNLNYKDDNTYNVGYGWWLSCYENLLWETNSKLSGKYPIIYWDADRTKHHFIKDGTNKFKDEDGLGLSFEYFPNNASEAKFTLTDKKGNKKIFDGGGFLRKVIDSNNNCYTVNYTTINGRKRVSNIVGSNGKISFGYFPSSNLDYIEDTAGRRTYYEMTYNNRKQGYLLTKIKYSDGKNVNYEYDTDGNLTNAIDIDGFQMFYSYTPVSPHRVKRYTETNNQNIGSFVDIAYKHNETVFKENNDENRIYTYQFNNFGQTVSIKDAQGNAEYYKRGTTGGNTNKITLSSKPQKTTINLFKNSNAGSLESWGEFRWTDATGTTELSNTKYIGNKSIMVNKTNASSSSRLLRAQLFSVPANGGTYTFSGQIKTEGITNFNKGGANLFFRYQNAEGKWLSIDGEMITGTNDWKRYSVTGKLPKGARNVSACVSLTYEMGKAYFDCLQLESGETASRYNLLENNGLDIVDNGVPKNWSVRDRESATDKSELNYSTNPEIKNSYFIKGNPSLYKNLAQEINVSGKSGDSYVFAGWAKSDSVPIENRLFGFSLVLEFYGANGKCIERASENFNYGTDQWQYISKEHVTKNAYNKIKYYFCYYNNANNVYFDSPQLYKEEFGESFTYDKDGNVISAADLAKNQSTFEYGANNNELIKQVNPQGGKFEYTYNSKKPHQLDSASGAGVDYKFKYDQYGNPISVQTEANTNDAENLPYINSSAIYNSNGNFISSLTDARGNSVYFDYNTSKGTLNSATDAKGNKTHYQYNEKTDALESISKDNTVNGKTQTITNSYKYNNDKLSSITHNGFDYSFEYDWLGNNTKVNIGNQNLITNQYDNRKGLLTKSTYGNGYNSDNIYDVEDRLIEKKYNNKTAFKYVYNNNGALGLLKDFINSVDYQYTYDLSGRLTKRVESNGFEVNYGYDKNNINKVTYKFNNASNTTNLNFNKDNIITNLSWDNKSIDYNYDNLNRLSKKTISKKDNDKSTSLLTTNYGFVSGQNVKQTNYNAEAATGRVVNGDFNGDGKDDVASLYDCGSSITKIHVWLSNGKDYEFQGDNGWWNSGAGSGYGANAISKRVVSGDFNGDGKDDIAAMFDYGPSQSRIHVWLSTGQSFNYQSNNGWWDSGPNSGYGAGSVKGRMVSGDFNADGKDDIAAMFDYGPSQSRIHVWLSTGQSFNYQSNNGWWDSGPNSGYGAGSVTGRMVSGDFNADGKADISAMFDYGPSRSRIHVWLSTGKNFNYQSNEGWYDNSGYGSSRVTDRMVSGDFNADGKADVAVMYDYGSSLSRIHVMLSTGKSFAYQGNEGWYDSGSNGYNPNDITGRFISGDFNADGKDDIMGLENYGENCTNIAAWESTGSALTFKNSLWNSAKQKISSGKATTTLLESITNGDNSIKYTYDENGNIETISENNQEKAKYYYDNLNQLIREDNKYTNKTVVYVYDNGGNILTKTEYPYNTGSINGLSGKIITYGYNDPQWKDKMTSYDGQNITYDEIGNPLTYRNGMNFTWQNGRQLAKINKVETALSFRYDSDGLRTQKTVNNKTTEYFTDGSKIIYEARKDAIGVITDTLYYTYDSNGDLVSFNLKNNSYKTGADFYYVRNGQNDVIGIIDNTGAQVVNYTYDTWGKPTSISGTLAETVGKINPFLYRGYYYDSESGLYYLQSRYYDPEVCRFLNADAYFSTGQGLLGSNMFTYCNNSPVSNYDPYGQRMLEVGGDGYAIYNPITDNVSVHDGVEKLAGFAVGKITHDLGKGWIARIDQQNDGAGTKRHVMVQKNRQKYSQNKDGSPHDGSKGDPPKSVRKKLKAKTGWDWDRKKNSYDNQNKLMLHNNYCDLAEGNCTCGSGIIAWDSGSILGLPNGSGIRMPMPSGYPIFGGPCPVF